MVRKAEPAKQAVDSRWFGVRCFMKHGEDLYEERVTIWRTRTFDEALDRALAENQEVAEVLDAEPLDVAQAFLIEGAPGRGAEVFSLIRKSPLEPDEYLLRFFETGEELQQHSDE